MRERRDKGYPKITLNIQRQTIACFVVSFLLFVVPLCLKFDCSNEFQLDANQKVPLPSQKYYPIVAEPTMLNCVVKKYICIYQHNKLLRAVVTHCSLSTFEYRELRYILALIAPQKSVQAVRSTAWSVHGNLLEHRASMTQV